MQVDSCVSLLSNGLCFCGSRNVQLLPVPVYVAVEPPKPQPLRTSCNGLLCHTDCPAHVLVRGVSAAADEACLELRWPAVLADGFSELGEWVGEVGGEGPVDVGLQLSQVDLNHLVVHCSLISLEVSAEEGETRVQGGEQGQLGQCITQGPAPSTGLSGGIKESLNISCAVTVYCRFCCMM